MRAALFDPTSDPETRVEFGVVWDLLACVTCPITDLPWGSTPRLLVPGGRLVGRSRCGSGGSFHRAAMNFARATASTGIFAMP